MSFVAQTRRLIPCTMAALMSLPALPGWAGPRVGTVVGVPSEQSTTIDARVLSSTPVVAQVAVPVESCYDELRTQAPRSSGAGALIGAIAGAAVGNALGNGSGRAIATGVGLIGGAALGNHIETDGRTGSTRTVRRCEQQTGYENQVVAYNVTYEVNGRRYTTQMDHEPGRTIPVQLTVNPVSQGRAPVQSVSSYADDGYEQAVFYTPPPLVIQSYDRHGSRWDRWGDRRYRHHRHGDHH